MISLPYDMVQLTPEVQEQLNQQKANCPFCKILRGEINTEFVFKDSKMYCILDINPWILNHILLVPNEHYPILPYIDDGLFGHIFGMMPEISGGLKKGLVSTGINIFIANGAAAGQQSQHFLLHLLPRDESDGFSKFEFYDIKAIDENKQKGIVENLKKMVFLRMNQFIQNHPIQGQKASTPDFLKDIVIDHEIIYEDAKVLCVVPKNPQVEGHIQIFSKEEEKFIENLSRKSSFHLFQTAKICSGSVFESMEIQGTNIIVKSGYCTDNHDGRLSVHVLPRNFDDDVGLKIDPMSDRPDIKKCSSKVKDALFMVEYKSNHPDEFRDDDKASKEDENILSENKSLEKKQSNETDGFADDLSYPDKKPVNQGHDKLDEIRSAVHDIQNE
jgi:histidine triad (HIT) family protein